MSLKGQTARVCPCDMLVEVGSLVSEHSSVLFPCRSHAKGRQTGWESSLSLGWDVLRSGS